MRRAERHHTTFTMIVKRIKMFRNIWMPAEKIIIGKYQADYSPAKPRRKKTDYKRSAKPHDLRQIEDMNYQIREYNLY
mgnify:CR=1 FL=1